MLLVEAPSCRDDVSSECFRFKEDLAYIANPAYIKAYPWLKAWQRHLGKTNFLFMDGHVDRLTPPQAVLKANNQEHYLD
jgi:prepilin-type processing-associated H-X9-DG protein